MNFLTPFGFSDSVLLLFSHEFCRNIHIIAATEGSVTGFVPLS